MNTDTVDESASVCFDADRIANDEIRKRIRASTFVLIEYKRETVSPTWQNLWIIADQSIPQNVLNGWVICKYCDHMFRTHPKLSSDGKRENYELTSPAKDLDVYH